MPYLDPHLLGSLIRWLHVASMAGLLGGAILLWGVALQSQAPGDGERDEALLVVAQTYEWLFWAAVGLLVMTGVGNLGAFGSSLPGRETAWGGKLIVKLAAVGALALLSLPRTLLVVHLGASPPRAATPLSRRILRGSYAGTALLAASILAVAVSLAHG